MSKYLKVLLVLVVVFVILDHTKTVTASPPYPPSDIISGIVWDTNTLERRASGSDNWVVTWGPDDNIYTSWGDGGGFGGADMGLGVGRIVGDPESFTGSNLWGEPRGYLGGKSLGIVSIEGILYMWVGPNSGWNGSTEVWLQWSADLGQTWQKSGLFFTYPDGFSKPSILNFGRNYEGARDNYVYSYGYDRSSGKSIQATKLNLMRVLKSQIIDRSAYEFFKGLDGDNNATWTSDLTQVEAVFEDVTGRIADTPSVVYNSALNRYILCKTFDASGTYPHGGLGVFEASEPWGPWKTIEYTDSWMGGDNMYFCNFSSKWTSNDGLTMWMIFTGYGADAIARDAYQHMKGVLTLVAPSDTSAPTSPGALNADPVSDMQIDLNWTAASDPESGIGNYNVYRDGALVASPSGTNYSDTGLIEGTSYLYEVSAVNGASLEGIKSAAIASSTVADTAAPTIVSVSAADTTRIVVVFSELVGATSANDASNYAISGGIIISSASLESDLKTVSLVTSTHVEGPSYQLTVNNIQDRATTPNVIVSNSPASYNFISVLVLSNLNVSSGKNYTPVSGGFDNGALVFIDRSYLFEDVPSLLAGGTYIQTANDDKAIMGLGFLTFDVNQDVAVYVAHDDRSSVKPSWMDSFVDSREKVTIAGQPHSLWRKDFEPGAVSLGGNAVSSGSMYSVIVLKLGDAPTLDTSPPDPPTGLSVE